MYEVEIKAKLNNREEIMEKLHSMGCVFGDELHQIDYIFIPEKESFPPPLGVPVLRVRKQNESHLFTLKIPQSSRQDCIEKEFEISDGNEMLEVIKLIGYKQVPTVEKKRIKTTLQDMEIVLDLVKGLGEFIEIEKIVETSDPEARARIQEELFSFLSDLGITKEDHVVDGKYDIMLFEKYGMN